MIRRSPPVDRVAWVGRVGPSSESPASAIRQHRDFINDFGIDMRAAVDWLPES
jgi:hypothetical protein